MKLIQREELQIGKLYFIECLSHDENYNIVRNNYIPISVGIFQKLNLIENSFVDLWYEAVFSWFPAKKIRDITNLSDINYIKGFTVHLNKLWNFYEVEKFKIQSDMETRTVNIMLRNIIGDEYVRWN
jgi:hypothetical protein